MATWMLQIRGNIVLNAIARAVDLVDRYGEKGPGMQQSDCYESLLTDLAHYAKAGGLDLVEDVKGAIEVAQEEEYVAFGAAYDPKVAGHD